MSAFDDLNRDGQQDSGEPLLAGVAFTLFNDQIVVDNYVTDGLSEPHCVESLSAGTYHVTRSIAPNEILTTQGDWAMTVTDGTELNLAFGSYHENGAGVAPVDDIRTEFETRIAGTPPATATPPSSTGEGLLTGRSLIIVLLVIGIIALLLAVAVLIFWFANSRNSENKSAGEEK
jgi:hypothetical protein